jgi:hypothetical protein
MSPSIRHARIARQTPHTRRTFPATALAALAVNPEYGVELDLGLGVDGQGFLPGATDPLWA